MRRRYDVGRASLALVAGMLAAAGLYAAVVDQTLLSRELVAAVLATSLVVAAAFALWPSGPHWSTRRRWLTVGFVAAAVVAALPSTLFAITVAGCICPGGGPSAPPLLGMGHRYWILLAIFAVPVLMSFAALLPQRRGRTPESPEA